LNSFPEFVRPVANGGSILAIRSKNTGSKIGKEEVAVDNNTPSLHLEILKQFGICRGKKVL